MNTFGFDGNKLNYYTNPKGPKTLINLIYIANRPTERA